MKERLSVPVLVAGRILDPDQAEEALATGDCDLVAMTRAIIADPDMPRRAQQGEVTGIRPCIAINEGCIGRLYSGMPIVCAVNPTIADDSLDEFRPAENRRRVVVVGGGPAGMEAARVAAERGHKVTLLERAQRLGGQTASAAAAPERPHYGRHVEWLERELTRLGVDVRLETEATVDSVLDLNPDAVILANGSRAVIPSEAEGVESRCTTDVEVLDGSVAIEPDARVLVYDREGKYRGGSIANFVAEAGVSRVELATPLFAVCEDLDEVQKPATFRRLAKNDVVLSPNQLLAGQRDEHLLLSDEWSGRKRVVQEADLIVFVGYQAAEDTLFQPITNASPDIEVHVVGDAVAPRRLNDAVLEGVRVGSTI
jgi:dimethylglycine catabolism A